jgi:hypothetical protein
MTASGNEIVGQEARNSHISISTLNLICIFSTRAGRPVTTTTVLVARSWWCPGGQGRYGDGPRTVSGHRTVHHCTYLPRPPRHHRDLVDDSSTRSSTLCHQHRPDQLSAQITVRQVKPLFTATATISIVVMMQFVLNISFILCFIPSDTLST